MNIFFDLDGTLWDSSIRLYSLFCDLAGDISISYDDYWNKKRFKISNEQILESFGYDDEQIKSFVSKWMLLIEDAKYLNLDTLFPFTKIVLNFFNEKGCSIYYVTLRQSAARALQEIKDKGIEGFCTRCLVSEAKITKEQLVRDAGIHLTADDMFVGDTGIDVMTGKSLGMKSVAVLSGFRNKAILETYKPDIIINNISELL